MLWIRKAQPFVVGLVGAAAGTVLVLSVLHLWTLYWSLRTLIEFINRYGPKIQALP